MVEIFQELRCISCVCDFTVPRTFVEAFFSYVVKVLELFVARRRVPKSSGKDGLVEFINTKVRPSKRLWFVYVKESHSDE